MSLFLSTYVNKIDKKGRISVPASFRTTLAPQSFPGVVLFRSLRSPCLEGSGIDRMQQLSKGLDHLIQFSSEQSDLAASIFADAQQLPFDSEGRISLPESLIEFTKIKDTASFVGCGATFQIWNPDRFKTHQNEARQRVQKQELGIRIKSATQQEDNA